jgi:hypothetical protein
MSYLAADDLDPSSGKRFTERLTASQETKGSATNPISTLWSAPTEQVRVHGSLPSGTEVRNAYASELSYQIDTGPAGGVQYRTARAFVMNEPR